MKPSILLTSRLSFPLATAIAALLASGASATAQTNNYFGTTGTLDGSVWSTIPAGPYTDALNATGGAIINFENAAPTITGASITVAGINATANAAISTISGTISNEANAVIPIDVATGATLDFSTQSFTSSATAGYIKNGAGVLALAGGTYGGGFTLNAGTLVVRGVNAMGGTAGNTLTINGGILAANATRDLTAKYGGGITIGGDFTFGATTGLAVSASNLTFTNNVSLGAATRTITLGGTGTYALGGVISTTGAAGLTVGATAAGTLALSGANSYTGATTINGGTLQLGNAGTTGTLSTSSAIINNGTFRINRSNAVVQGTDFATVISGSGAVVQAGSSSLTLSGENTYSGGTTLSAGTLNINNGGSSSSNSAIGTGTFTISGGTIDNTSGAASSTVTLATNNALALNNNFIYTGTGSRNLNLGTGAVTMAATRQITVSAGTLTIGGNIASTGAGITKAGAGTLVLSGTNSQSGTIDSSVANSTVIFNGGAAMGSSALQTGGAGISSTFHIQQDAAFSRGNFMLANGGSTMNLVVDRQTLGTSLGMSNTAVGSSSGNQIGGGSTLTPSAGSNISVGTVPTFTFTQGIGSSSRTNDTATATLNPNGVNLVIAALGVQVNGTRSWTLGGTSTGNTVSGTIGAVASSTTAFIKNNTSTWTVSGNSTFGQPVSITNGVLKLGGVGSGVNSPLGTVAGNTAVTSTGTLDLNGRTLVTAEPLSLSGSGTSNSGALANTGVAATFSGPITLGAAARIVAGGNILLTSATAITSTFGLTLDGTATGSSISTAINTGANSVTKEGSGTWTLSNSSNSYSGATTITGGTLKLGANNVLPNASNVSIGNATLDADTRSDTAGTLDATGNAVINLGTGAALAFANSSGVTSGVWAGALNITGTFVSGNDVDPGLGVNPGSIRFGVDNTGLTASQLADITVNGSGTYTLDAFGYLVASGGGPGPLDHFAISAISSPQTVGMPITGITLTAQDASNATVTSFTGTVTFGGTGGFSGNSATFTAGVLSGVSVIPTNAGSGLTFTVTDIGTGKNGSATITTIQTQYDAWSGGLAFNVDTNNDGVHNGLAWMLGAGSPSANAVGLLPTVSQSGGDLVMTFTCLKVAGRGTAALKLQHSKDLGISDLWTVDQVSVPDMAGPAGVTDIINFTVPSVNGNAALVNLQAIIPASAASPGSKLFGRLEATTAP